MQMFLVANNTLFEQLFALALYSHHGGQGSIPSQDMSVSGPLVEDGDDLGLKSLHNIEVFVNKNLNKEPNLDRWNNTYKVPYKQCVLRNPLRIVLSFGKRSGAMSSSLL